jgi:hypothetical protein
VGLLKELVLLPVAPLRGTLWISEKIAEEVDRRELSEGAGVQQLDRLEEQRARGELDEAEAEAQQEQVIARLLSRADSPAAQREEQTDDG